MRKASLRLRSVSLPAPTSPDNQRKVSLGKFQSAGALPSFGSLLCPPPQELKVDRALGEVEVKWEDVRVVFHSEGLPFRVRGRIVRSYVAAGLGATGPDAIPNKTAASQVVRLAKLQTSMESLQSLPSEANTEERYMIEVSPKHILIQAVGETGLFRGAQTLLQLLLVTQARPGVSKIMSCRIHDWPSIRTRGVMLDWSHSRVPNCRNLLRLVEVAALLKLNEIQVYTEAGSHERGGEWSEDITQGLTDLGVLCLNRYIRLVPIVSHVTKVVPPPKAFHPFAPPSRATRIKVVSPPRSEPQEEWEVVGTSMHSPNIRVYPSTNLLDSSDPDAIIKLRPQQTLLVDAGYEFDHPFESRCERLKEFGFDFYTCPGSSGWLSVAGRLDNVCTNIWNAVWATTRHGGKGCILHDWSDFQVPLALFPPLVVCAAATWNAVISKVQAADLRRYVTAVLQPQLDVLVFRDSNRSLGRVACELANMYTAVPSLQAVNSALVVWSFVQPGSMLDSDSLLIRSRHKGHPPRRMEKKHLERVEKEDFVAVETRCKELLPAIASATPQHADAKLIKEQYQCAVFLLVTGARLWQHRIDAGLRTCIEDLPAQVRVEINKLLVEALDCQLRVWAAYHRSVPAHGLMVLQHTAASLGGGLAVDFEEGDVAGLWEELPDVALSESLQDQRRVSRPVIYVPLPPGPPPTQQELMARAIEAAQKHGQQPSVAKIAFNDVLDEDAKAEQKRKKRAELRNTLNSMNRDELLSMTGMALAGLGSPEPQRRIETKRGAGALPFTMSEFLPNLDAFDPQPNAKPLQKWSRSRAKEHVASVTKKDQQLEEYWKQYMFLRRGVMPNAR